MPAPERRADSRVEHPPLILSMEGRRYESSDWSMSGFCLHEYFRDLRPGERIRGLVSLAPAEPSGHLEAEVVRVCERDGIGLRIAEIEPSTFQAMVKSRYL